MKNKNILNVMFLVIILNMIPTVLLKLVDLKDNIYSLLNAIFYFFTVSILIYVSLYNKFKLNKKKLICLFIFAISTICALIYDYIFLGAFAFQDIIAAISVVLNIYLFLFIFTNFHITKENLQEFMKKIVYVGLISCIYNIVINGSKFMNILSLSSSYSVSFGSFFPNRNQFGLFMVICILACLYSRDLFKKKIYYLIIVLFSLNLIFSMARNALLGLIVIISFWLFENTFNKRNIIQKRKLVLFTIISISFVIFLIYCLYNPVFYNNFTRIFLRIDSDNFDSGRFIAWKSAIKIANNNILFGVGRFMAINMCKNTFHYTFSHFHSNYFEIYVSYGILGIVLYINLLKNVINCIRGISDKWIKYVSFTSFSTFFVICVFETICRFSIGYIDTLTLVFFFVIPIMAGKSLNKNSITEKNDI